MSEQFKLGGIFTTVSVIITGVLGGLQGCSNGDPFVQELNPPAVTTTSTGATISGSAVKGLLTGADCIATNTAGIELYSSVGNESPCTSSRGRYSFQLLSNPTTPVVVTLQARTSMTQMLCDFPAGCGNGVAFGESLDLSNDFSLRAVVPTIPSTVTTQEVNISPWTEVATARAISSASSLSSVTTTQVESAYLEVASVLNNVLSLEGTSDEFDGNFFSIDLVDLAAPDQDDDIDSGEERSATLMSLASASLFNLVDTTNTSITSVVQNLSSAFSSDGEFNVNDTATGIADDNGIDLADIITGVGGVVQDIQSVLQPNAVTQLATFLNTSDLTTELSSIKSAADTLAELKESVVNVELDTTKPVNLIELAGESDFS
ncbi:MAG: hypothetical protein P8176_05550, partial [Gammaproteobacteria bacterium]